jgi:hypothetical protein
MLLPLSLFCKTPEKLCKGKVIYSKLTNEAKREAIAAKLAQV